MNRRVLALLAILPACSANIAQLDPTPNVLLARSPQTITLAIAPEVGESFAAPVDGNPQVQSLGVTQWHETLAAGFANGIARYFERAQKSADLSLVVKSAMPTLVPTPALFFNGQVRFAAELVDANHQIVKTWADTAVSRMTGAQSDASALVTSAVEAMYEEIANGMPVPLTAVSAR